MPLPSPNLDDRTWQQIMDEAVRRIERECPGWTDRSPSDPGMMLLELYAYLTDTMLYRLNRLPQKVYIELLNLIGLRLQPPAAASASLRFSRASPATETAIDIPRGTRVTISRASTGGEPPLFVTARAATIAAGATAVDVLAYQCDQIEGELAGTGTGLPGLSLTAARPPLIAPTGDDLDLVVGVESRPGELGERAAALQFNGKAYRVWREVESFTNLDPNDLAYVVDRMSGTISFAPAARLVDAAGKLSDDARPLGAVPTAGREIRLWYRRGGGAEGNVVANTLSTLKDPITGVQVTNPDPATGGRAAETLPNALIRGPRQLHSRQVAVTARDFEQDALESSRAIARARALTRAALWSFATPGTVEVLLVPYLPDEALGGGPVTLDLLQKYQTEGARTPIQTALDERRPLGTTCLVNWTRYKTVRVSARIVVGRAEDPAAVRARVLASLYQTIDPLPVKLPDGTYTAGWPFGQALRASHVYDVALHEPGVRWVDTVKLLVDAVPNASVQAMVADFFQPNTWFAGSADTLFRSLNDAAGWEPAGHFAGEQIAKVEVHPGRAGLVAVVTTLPDGSAHIHVSLDAGETWPLPPYALAFPVQDLAWALRNNNNDPPILLLATDKGLYELPVRPDGSPVQVLVDPANQGLAFYSIVVAAEAQGTISVAVAAQNTAGVYLSSGGGQSNTFRKIGLQGQDIRQLAVQADGPRRFLWAGAASPGGDDPGTGVSRWELRGAQDPPDGWRPFSANWKGGSCKGIAFQGTGVVAASHRQGVLRLDPGAAQPAWVPSDVSCGLPLRDPGRFFPVDSVAVDPHGQSVLAGGIKGVFRSDDHGVSYTSASNSVFLDKVTLPDTWLFVSGVHDIKVVSEDETS